MRQPPRLRSVALILLGGALVCVEPLRHAAFSVLRLPLMMLNGGAGVLATLPRLPSLTREHDTLQAELARLQLETADLREALRHASRAEELQALVPSRQGVVAAVIGRSTVPTQHTLLLDRGERHGLSQDSVILHGSGVIGRIAELHPTTCLVLLLTDPESRVAGLVERSRETGLLVGRGHGACELIYLDADADVQEGDRVVTAGLGGAFPKGLLLGTVTRVVRQAEIGSASAWVKPAARLNQLEEVLCVPPPTTPR